MQREVQVCENLHLLFFILLQNSKIDVLSITNVKNEGG